jgi:LysM domain
MTTTLTTASRQRPRFIPAAVALTQAMGLIVGLPVLLVRLVGWPLPHEVPLIADIQRAYQMRYIPDRFVIGSLACAGWICWATITCSALAAGFAHARSIEFHKPTLVPSFVQGLVGRWITAATLLVALTTRPATAATPPAKTVISQPMPNTVPTSPFVTRATTPPPLQPPSTSSSQPSRAGSLTTTRSYVAGSHETYWEVAEKTLGSGERWREILNANPTLGQVDLVPAGFTLNVPNDHGVQRVEVEKGDNLWKIAATELADARHTEPGNAEIASYWLAVIEANEPTIKSGDPDLIYPGETITLPTIAGDERTGDLGVEQPIESPAEPTPINSAPPVTNPGVPITTVPSIGAIAAVVIPASANPTEPPDDFEDDTPFEVPWIKGLAITGVASAGILLAWHAQRRRRMRAHKLGDRVPTLTEPDKDLISQLRGIAEEHRAVAIDQTFRYLATTVTSASDMSPVTVGRAGRHSVELLLDDPTAPTPKGFLRLDQQAIVTNPGIPTTEFDASIAGILPPCPALVTIGTDDVGTIVLDLERTSAISIEAELVADEIEILTAIVTDLATQPWAATTRVLMFGVPATINPEGRVSRAGLIDEVMDAVERQLQSQTDDVITLGTHTVRARSNNPVPALVVVLARGNQEVATAIADAAKQRGSAIALVTADPIPNSPWRLVTVGGRTTLEPTGLTVGTLRSLRPSKIDNEANEQLKQTFGPPTPEPKREVAAEVTGDSDKVAIEPLRPEDIRAEDAETQLDHGHPQGLEVIEEQSIESGTEVIDESEDNVSMPELPLLVETDEHGFDQLVLIREPAGVPLNDAMTVEQKIDAIMQRKGVELVLLDGQPRIEGIVASLKQAARSDEIVTFLALNGPSTIRQVAVALWPEKMNPGDSARQMLSRARFMLGADESKRQRLSLGTRSAPYSLHDVGCDWHRFEQLVALAGQSKIDDDKVTLLRAALTLVRSAPFESLRANSFHWASDQCFDTRMRLAISDAANRLTAIDPEHHSDWAEAKSLIAVPVSR